MKPDARRTALDALVRIDTDGAFANLVLPAMLQRSRLSERDRAFVTELVYGVTRMGRACDWLVDRFLTRDVQPEVRAALRLGAYQLRFLGTPPHAAVSATVSVAPPRAKGLVNAVLRKVAGAPADFPDDATRLSYPDWIVSRLSADLGHDTAVAALEAMNASASARTREDGYVQDLASQWVAEAVGAQAGERVADLCAAPGGKATWMARTGAFVAASDVNPRRCELIAGNIRKLGSDTVTTLAADGAQTPYPPGVFDRVLVDAPCSGLGHLRRRPDARWRIEEADVARLAALQRDLLGAAAKLVRPGGTLVYSVCTLDDEESSGVDAWLAERHPELEPVDPPGAPWEPHGRGARLLPHAAGTDGMCLFVYCAQ